MNTHPTPCCAKLPASLLREVTILFLATVCTLVEAPPTTTGSIGGRVFNSRMGQYLENVRVAIEGAAFEICTDASGAYTFHEVPSGVVTLRAHYTGAESKTKVLTLRAGERIRRDFDLGDAASAVVPLSIPPRS